MRYLLLLLASIGIISGATAQNHTSTTVDSFLNQPFGYEGTMTNIIKMSRIKFKVTKEPVVNMHNPTVTDTIYHLKKGKNLISLYKGQYNTFVYHVVLRSRKAKLMAGVHPRMERQEFFNTFKELEDVGQLYHTFYNSDSTAIAQVSFTASKKLKQIEIEYMVD